MLGNELALEQVRLDLHHAQPRGTADLELDMIPDAGGGAVLTGGRVGAAGLAIPMAKDAFDEALVVRPNSAGFLAGGVDDDRDVVSTKLYLLGDVKLEFLKVAFVLTHRDAVDFRRREIIHAVEDDEHPVLRLAAMRKLEIAFEAHPAVEILEAVQVPVG